MPAPATAAAFLATLAILFNPSSVTPRLCLKEFSTLPAILMASSCSLLLLANVCHLLGYFPQFKNGQR
jgi:hypothetical protein